MENFLFDLFLTLTFGQGARISAILTNNNFPPAILMMIVGDRRMAGWQDGRMAGGSVKRTEISKVFSHPEAFTRCQLGTTHFQLLRHCKKKKTCTRT